MVAGQPAPTYCAALGRRVSSGGMSRKDLGRRIMGLSLRSKARLLVLMVRDERVPMAAKMILPAMILYLAMPLDLIPDFIPVLGQLDDLLLIALGLGLFLWLTPRAVVEEHLEALQ